MRASRTILASLLGEPAVLQLTRAYDRLNRISFDRSPEGRRSASRLRELRDSGRGRRCFVIGNGPSLAGMDLTPLRDEVTFGLNRVYLLFEQLGFPTTFIVSTNRLVIEQSGAEILATGRPAFLAWHSRDLISANEQPVYLPTARAREFSLDPARGLWEGATVTFVALQLAYYMGYDPVVLIGVDHSFATEGPAHREVTSAGDDPNHFDPRYFGKGFRWQLPDLQTSVIAYKLARAAFAADRRRILDATVGGRLDVFPKVSYQALMNLAPSDPTAMPKEPTS